MTTPTEYDKGLDVNIRSLSRGDAVVIGAAVLLFIASFLPLYTFDTGFGSADSRIGWSADFFPVLPSLFLAGIIGAGLIVTTRFVNEATRRREFLGLRLDQWGIALSVTSAWAGFWTLVGGADQLDTGAGQILGFLAALVLAGAAAATPMVPALQAPLVNPAAKTATPAPQQPQQPQYGQPGGPAQPPQPGYGYPGQTAVDPQPYGGQQPAPQQPAPDPAFQPFWFAVPVQRPLYDESGSPTPVAELAPGTWYLAVEQRGQALVAQTQDGRRGVLQDTSNIQRG